MEPTPYKLTRRNVIAMIPTGAVMLCPAVLNAAAADWGDIPTDTPIGQDQLITLAAGPAEVDITDLAPGQIAVIARPTEDDRFTSTGMTHYIAVMRRTAEQINFGQANDRPGTVQNPEYFVVDLLCSHRGKAIGLTGDPATPFACTDRRGRHSSDYDASGFGIAGASEGEYLSIPDYNLQIGSSVILALA